MGVEYKVSGEDLRGKMTGLNSQDYALREMSADS